MAAGSERILKSGPYGMWIGGAIVTLLAAGIPAYLYWSGTPVGEICGTFSRSNLFGIWAVAGFMAGVLLLGDLYMASRRLAEDGVHLFYRTWFVNRNCRVMDLTHVTLESDADLHAYLRFWLAGNVPVIDTYLGGWKLHDLRVFLGALRRLNPNITVSPDLGGQGK